MAYAPIIEMIRGVPVPVETVAEESFRLTAARLREKITKKTKLLVLPYPNNPTGAGADDRFYTELIAFAKRWDIAVLHDNAYSELVFDGKQMCIRDSCWTRRIVSSSCVTPSSA